MLLDNLKESGQGNYYERFLCFLWDCYHMERDFYLQDRLESIICYLTVFAAYGSKSNNNRSECKPSAVPRFAPGHKTLTFFNSTGGHHSRTRKLRSTCSGEATFNLKSALDAAQHNGS